jgi:hypothetical protein
MIPIYQHMMEKEFQHCTESLLTEGLRMKRKRIQSALISNRVRANGRLRAMVSRKQSSLVPRTMRPGIPVFLDKSPDTDDSVS